MAITRRISHDLYPRRAVSETRQAYRAYCTARVSPLAGNAIELALEVVPEQKNREREVVLGFFNYLLDRSAQLLLEESQ